MEQNTVVIWQIRVHVSFTLVMMELKSAYDVQLSTIGLRGTNSCLNPYSCGNFSSLGANTVLAEVLIRRGFLSKYCNLFIIYLYTCIMLF